MIRYLTTLVGDAMIVVCNAITLKLVAAYAVSILVVLLLSRDGYVIVLHEQVVLVLARACLLVTVSKTPWQHS
jgi:hypothetical protein